MSDSVSPGVALRLGDFVNANVQKDTGGTWQLESGKMLEIHLAGNRVFTKVGAMVAYYGDLKFTRAGAGGAAKWAKAAMTGEGAATTEVVGSGILYCADAGKRSRSSTSTTRRSSSTARTALRTRRPSRGTSS